MASSNNMDSLLKEILLRMNSGNKGGAGGGSGGGGGGKNCGNGSQGNSASNLPVSPSQALVILGILGGVLQVDSVLVDRSQEVQIVLSGSLKQKTELDRLVEKLGAMPFDEVVKTILGRLL